MDVRLPKIGDSPEGVVVSILVKPGDTIEAGQTILELENEKAIAPVPSTAAGKVGEIKVREGQKISVGTVLLTVEGEGAATPSPKAPGATPASGETSSNSARPKKAEAPGAAGSTSDDVDEDDESDHAAADTGEEAGEGAAPPASPYVRKIARDLGLRLSRVRPGGGGGRVTVDDLARYVARLERRVARAGRYGEEPKGLVYEPVNIDFAQFGPVTSEPLSETRKIIAARMVESRVSLPHVHQFDVADLTRIESLRTQFKPAYEKAGVKLTPTAFVLHALVSVLKKHPRFNSSLNEVTETLILKQYYHLGIAVDTDAGLLVPVLRNADQKSLLELARELAAIAARARERKVTAEDLKGGSFTISNQGAIGGGHFTPIINKPEVAILGLGRTRREAVVTAEGKIEARPMLPLTIGYDHRVVDGAAAARFTVDLVAALQDFPESAVKL